MMRWLAHVDFFFECPACGLVILEGNPRKCPHQQGPRAWFNAGQERVANWDEVVARCGTGKPRGKTTEELIEAQCPKGT